ncbi:MAG: tannase/feruloyl esterase family alpha/beta hydrolase [Paracoccus sp. (in: a-proteobacteria)]|uniref:tannase/feruloyl esterase family alpha/beta hydrolase n=1 Tax=Paracoccus sp. TaxID=267 RepID=UPI0026E0D53A|nr:tannase/feruloyl esterase family alpha/beta hydrolase [Paracoccus sp. (in: a-proteobacteria)]MDO5622985.1 tannase/feruloyl esterase family alpha/beta hydrolase [Paracoccus sp. (in: a-proteobacteria)]
MKHLMPGSAALLASTMLAGAAQAACTDLTELTLRGVEIGSATEQAADSLPPDPNSAMTGSTSRDVPIGAHCLVEGKIGDRQGVGGQYGTRFQMRLPDDWNGHFLFQGGGGMDGFIAPAIGSIPSNGSTALPALARGYAVVSMDGGHDGRDADFAQDQQARLDFAYASIGRVTDTAKAIIAAHYGREADRSLFMGCSNGGREAMIAAQRYPTEFDGVVAGNPGFHLTAASLTQAWDVRALMSVAPNGDLSQALTQDDLDMVAAAILEQCDALDGITDGIVNAASQCAFDLEGMRSQLGDAKTDALATVMAGPKGADGRALYSDWPFDPGIASPGWRAWKLGTAETPALNVVLGGDSLSRLFLTPPREGVDPMSLDFDQAAQDTRQMHGLLDATSTFLTTFADRGGKMVVFQGAADPVFSTNDLTRWYRQAASDTPGDFARLFVVPGMTHCGGGPALDDFDPLTLLEGWMDSGEAPTQMPATGTAFPGVTQPVCVWPAEAHFTGADPAQAASYECRES